MTQYGPIPEDQLLAYFEGTLTPDEAQSLAARLEQDAEGQAMLAEWDRQNAAVQALFAPIAQEPIPDRLRAVIRDAPEDRALPSARFGPLLRIAAMLGVLAIGASGGWFAARMQSEGAPTLAGAAIGAHLTYVSEVRHPVEVEASQAAHLTGWVTKRLGHPVAPPDFAANGFRLIGGRVLPGVSGPAALFMYENDLGRRVTLYVAPQDQDVQTAFQFTESGGVQSFYWMDGTLNYAVVGDIPRETLRQIALAAYDQLV